MDLSIETVNKYEALITDVIDTSYHLHKELGPGLLESVYEAILEKKLIQKHKVDRQQAIKIEFDGLEINEGFRVDLLVDDILIIELKSVETLSAVHTKQLLTYLRLMNLPIGLLINFGSPLIKDGIKRVINNRFPDYEEIKQFVLRNKNRHLSER